MKTIKNIFYIYLFIQILYYAYLVYNKGYKFDANDPDNSLQIMLHLTNPLERTTFLKEFDIACDGTRCINLHGLTKKEIHVIFENKRIR